MSSSVRQRVLSVYRNIVRLGRRWEAIDPTETAKEREYIINEARTLFRKNKNLESLDEVEQHLKEAEARIGIAQHYGIPYPRPVNIPQNVLPPGGKRTKLKARERVVKHSRPIYVKSYEKS
jgi:hypothetical protein